MSAIKYGIAFLAGAAAGVLGTKTYFQTKYEKIAEEEIESVKQAKLYQSHLPDEEITYINPPADEEEEYEAKHDQVYHSSIEPMFAATMEADKAKETMYNRLAESEHPRDDTVDEPYRISEEEFSETELGNDKITLHYYTDDDILFNTADNCIEMGQTIGDEGLNIVRTSNDSELYFRNYTYGADYEVLRIKGSYYIE